MKIPPFFDIIPQRQGRGKDERKGVNGVDVQATYEKWKQEWTKHGKTPDDAVAWCKEQGLPADYVESLEELISEMEGLHEGQR